jgi:hypothetical protein
LILFSEEGIKLLLKFISKCSKDGKTINYLTTLSSLSYSSFFGGHGGRGRGIGGGADQFGDTSFETIIHNFISQYLNESSESCLYLMRNMNRISTPTPSYTSTSSVISAFSSSPTHHHHKGLHASIISSLESQLPQLIVMLAINVFPEFLQSEEYELWCQYEQLIITTTEFQSSDIFNFSSPTAVAGATSASPSYSSSTHDISGEYLSRIHCADFSSLVNRPQWILALARSFDSLPFPICIHSAKPPHVFLYANDCFLVSCGYNREELFASSIDILLTNPFDSIEQYPHLSYQQQYEHYQEYDTLLKELRYSIQNGLPSRNFLKLTTKSKRTVYNLMTLVPVTNLLGEYIYMISVHCNYQTITSLTPVSVPVYVHTPTHTPHGRGSRAGLSHGYSLPRGSSHTSEFKRQEFKQSSSSSSSRDSLEDYYTPASSPPAPHTHAPASTSSHQEAQQQQQQQQDQAAAKYIILIDHFIHCLPYRLHHTRTDNYLLVNTYLDESRAAQQQQQQTNESKLSEDVIV